MPHISACIGSIEVALASKATWPLSCTRAIQALSSARLRTVTYLLRSTGVLRAASARAAASEIGVPLRLPALSSLPPCVFGAPPLPLAGEGGVGVPPLAKRSPPASKRPPPGSLWRATALPSDPTSPASGRGE